MRVPFTSQVSTPLTSRTLTTSKASPKRLKVFNSSQLPKEGYDAKRLLICFTKRSKTRDPVGVWATSCWVNSWFILIKHYYIMFQICILSFIKLHRKSARVWITLIRTNISNMFRHKVQHKKGENQMDCYNVSGIYMLRDEIEDPLDEKSRDKSCEIWSPLPEMRSTISGKFLPKNRGCATCESHIYSIYIFA